MLWCNVSILIGSLLDATCNFQFKFARASCQVPVFDFPVLNVIIPHLCFEETGNNCPMINYLSTDDKKLATGLVQNANLGIALKNRILLEQT